MKLTKPIEWNGTEYVSLELDFDKLKGRDLIAVAREADVRRGKAATIRALDLDYQCCLAARASGSVVDMLDELCARDFVAACEAAQDFLLDSD